MLYMAFGFVSLLLYQNWLLDYHVQPEGEEKIRGTDRHSG